MPLAENVSPFSGKIQRYGSLFFLFEIGPSFFFILLECFCRAGALHFSPGTHIQSTFGSFHETDHMASIHPGDWR